MGRQIGFLMEKTDEDAFWEFLCSDPKIWAMNPPFKENKCVKLKKLPDLAKPWGRSIVIWHEDLCDEDILKYIETQGYWLINKGAKEVIEFLRSRWYRKEDQSLGGGRLWYERFRYDEDGNKVLKNPALDRLYDTLAKWIRKHGTLHKPSGDYYLPEAKERWWPKKDPNG